MSWLWGSSSDDSSSSSTSSSYEPESSYSSDSFSSFDSGASSSDFSRSGDSELQSFLSQEQQKATFQASVHQMNDLCWDTCMTSGYDSSRLSSKSETCISNCVERFIDSSLFIATRFAQLLSKQGGGALG